MDLNPSPRYRYRGALSARHFRGCLALALAARGCSDTGLGEPAPTEPAIATKAQDLMSAGSRMLAQLLSGLDATAKAGLPSAQHLTRYLGFGALTAQQFEHLRRTEDSSGHCGAEYLCAVLNTVFVLYDQLVDEDGGTPPAALTAFIREGTTHLFGARNPGTNRPFAGPPSVADPRAAPFCAVLAHWAELVLEHRPRANDDRGTWARLGRIILALFASHSALTTAGGIGQHRRMKLARRKSMLPFAAMSLVCRLIDPAAGYCDLRAALRLGRVCGSIDDAVDLLDDLAAGEANTLEQWIPDQETDLDDVAIYRLLDLACQETAGQMDRLPPRLRAYASDMIRLWNAPSGIACGQVAGAACGHTLIDRALQSLCDIVDGDAGAFGHHLRMPRLEGSMETHLAVVMQRAVILETLLEAPAQAYGVDTAVICRQTLELLLARNRHVRGGWSYVQTVPELPPDADDLGQVLLVLAGSGVAGLAESCEEPVRLYLNRQRPDGGIPTWLVDDPVRPADRRVREYLPVMGGWGTHVEVVANMACALALYDRARYSGPLASMADYLIAQQQPSGCWQSKWYDGPFYATYRCLLFLAMLGAQRPAMGRAVAFLRDSQRPDDAWGSRTEPSALCTALAVLGLLQVAESADDDRLINAGRWVLTQQRADGTWAAAPWVAFPFVGGHETYGSAAISTAFCTRALMALTAVYGRSSMN